MQLVHNTRLALTFLFVYAALVGAPNVASYAEDATNADIVVMSFDGDDYGDWTVEGTAFGDAPARGTLPGQMNVSGFQGAGLVNSYVGGDNSTGTLTSPRIEITRPYVNFLIGGGCHPGLSFELLVDGQVVRSAAGPNVQPGGSEKLDWSTWDVSEFQGKYGVFRVVDVAKGGWGHINVDEITLSVKKRSGLAFTRELEVVDRYLLLPIKSDGVQEYWVRIVVDGTAVREFQAKLAFVGQTPNSADFNACVDMTPYLGKSCKIIVEKAEEDSDFAPFVFSDELYGGAASYDEKYRPQFHFSPRFGWTNDPNGLVFYNGRYHLFYQHNPFSVNWGNMTWGHATSVDLMTWTEEGDELYPDKFGTIFSGSGAVDYKNTTGFQTDPNGLPPLVVMYTYNGPSMRYGEPASQALAYSLDDGKTFTKYEGNPTLPHIIGGNRDPKIFWYEPTQRWIVALYLDGEDYALFESQDLKSWRELCRIEKLGCSECPDIFELPVDGDESNKLWVFWGGNGKYLLGKFDGKTFERVSEPLNAKWGGNDYAAQSYSDTPGRRIQFAWMQGGSYPGMPFNQQFTVPRELTLRTCSEGVRLCVNPVKEVAEIREKELTLRAEDTATGRVWNPTERTPQEYDLLDVEATIKVGDATHFTLALRGQTYEFDVAGKTMKYGEVVAPLAIVDGAVTLRIVLDRTSIEIFANGGESQIASCFVPKDENDSPILETTGAVETSARVWTMRKTMKLSK